MYADFIFYFLFKKMFVHILDRFYFLPYNGKLFLKRKVVKSLPAVDFGGSAPYSILWCFKEQCSCKQTPLSIRLLRFLSPIQRWVATSWNFKKSCRSCFSILCNIFLKYWYSCLSNFTEWRISILQPKMHKDPERLTAYARVRLLVSAQTLQAAPY